MFFDLHWRNKGEKNYLLLFDSIEKMQVYDEDLIRQTFAGKKFLQNLHVTKKYLFDFILNALAGFQLGKTKESEIKRLLLFADMLKSRGLTKESNRRLQKAKGNPTLGHFRHNILHRFNIKINKILASLLLAFLFRHSQFRQNLMVFTSYWLMFEPFETPY